MKKLRVTVDGKTYDVEVEVLEDDELGGSSYGFPTTTAMSPMPSQPMAAPTPPPAAFKPQAGPQQPTLGDSNELTSPIAGTVVEIKVSAGTAVKENDVLLIIEAMKMNTNIGSPISGKVKEVKINNGDTVQQGQVLVIFE